MAKRKISADEAIKDILQFVEEDSDDEENDLDELVGDDIDNCENENEGDYKCY